MQGKVSYQRLLMWMELFGPEVMQWQSFVSTKQHPQVDISSCTNNQGKLFVCLVPLFMGFLWLRQVCGCLAHWKWTQD